MKWIVYSVAELASMYGVTRQTMYNHLRSDDVKPYLVQTNKGLKYAVDGINMLNVIMATKVTTHNKQTPGDELESKSYNNDTSNQDKIIQVLQQQIDELKADKLRLYEELREQRAFLASSKNEVKRTSLFKRFFK